MARSSATSLLSVFESDGVNTRLRVAAKAEVYPISVKKQELYIAVLDGLHCAFKEQCAESVRLSQCRSPVAKKIRASGNIAESSTTSLFRQSRLNADLMRRKNKFQYKGEN